MPTLKTVHRPQTIDAAIELLNRADVPTAVLAGGTSLVPALRKEVDELVDLQALPYNQIQHTAAQVKIGSLVTLQTLLADQSVPELLRDLARREGPNTFRNAGTVGGAVAAATGESEFVAGLLVCDAAVTIQKASGVQIMPLAEFLQNRQTALVGGIITLITAAKPAAAAADRVARTPQDQPIVAAVAAKTAAGECRLALCGVAATPVLADPEKLEALNPPGDFRGSSAYRRQMAVVLTQRALKACG